MASFAILIVAALAAVFFAIQSAQALATAPVVIRVNKK